MERLLAPEVQSFIKANTGQNVSKLALGKNPFPEIPFAEILKQIESRQKAKDKLPTWFETDSILYPEPISMEQASSEKTAQYKASLVSGKLIDLTGGFGVDDYYFSKTTDCVWHCERNSDLSAIVAHNFNVFGIENVECVLGDSSEFLKSTTEKFDWIYVDPSRRHETKGKVFRVSDCEPAASTELDLWLSKASNVLIKTAPLLDLSAGISELKHVKTIHIVSLKGDVRELLWQIEKEFKDPTTLKAIDLTNDKIFEVDFGNDDDATLGLPEKFLYEPNSAVMKTGAFAAVGNRFGLKKLHRHSHLYTANQAVDFPGRVFEIEQILPYDKASMKSLPSKLNVTTRNFPESVEIIRKKWKLADGGETYAFFTTDLHDKKIVLLCKKFQA